MVNRTETSHMPTPVDALQSPSTFSVTEEMMESLRSTRPWARFISILGFLAAGIMLVLGILTLIGQTFLADVGGLSAGVAGFSLFGALINLVLALFYFIPSLFLFRFAASIGRLLEGGNEKDMEAALAQQKSFWKFVGVLILMGVLLGILGVFAAWTFSPFLGVL